MDQQQVPEKPVSPAVRIFRSIAFLGVPLVLLGTVVWPKLASDQESLLNLAFVLLALAALTFIDRSVPLRNSKNLIIVVVIAVLLAGDAAFVLWRQGSVVAQAVFNPGIAPFDITVREVPVPVTRSRHFIVTLKRGQYPVTSFRYFWIAYTPQKVRIEWARLDTFKVIFDERYVATCNWSWGRQAIWTMDLPQGAQPPGDQP